MTHIDEAAIRARAEKSKVGNLSTYAKVDIHALLSLLDAARRERDERTAELAALSDAAMDADLHCWGPAFQSPEHADMYAQRLRLLCQPNADRSNAAWVLLDRIRVAEDQRNTISRAAAYWEDRQDEWSDAVSKAHPTRDGSKAQEHDRYGVAMRMVSNRHSKSALIALVNWLLRDRDALRAALEQIRDDQWLDYARCVRIADAALAAVQAKEKA